MHQAPGVGSTSVLRWIGVILTEIFY